MKYFLNLSMHKKLLLSPLVAIAFVVILGFVSYRGLSDQKSVIREIFESRFQIYQDSAKVMGDVKGVHASLYQVLNLSSINADVKVIDELGKRQIAVLQGTGDLIQRVMKRNLTGEERKFYSSSLLQVTEYKDAAAKVVDMATSDYNLATSMMKPVVDKFEILNRNLQGLMDLENKLSREKYDYAMQSFQTTLITFVAVFVAAIVLSILISAFMARFLLSVIRKVNDVVGLIAQGDLTRGIDIQARDEMGQLAQSVDTMRNKVEKAVGKSLSISHGLAESASEQAAALEETSASLNQTASMTKQNATNTKEANSLMMSSSKATDEANGSMKDLTKSMKDIADAGAQAQKIVKSIDEIAFQTNLLALNAAVEAARAGETGAGFAVVADEVRNLAMRATEAAKGTTGLIEDIMHKVQVGEEIVQVTDKAFQEVHDTSKKVVQLVGKIAEASQEQAEGIDEINRAVNEMNLVTQKNASLSEELSSAMSMFKTNNVSENAPVAIGRTKALPAVSEGDTAVAAL
jgi:methyl-accepting chemotaxis protein